MSAAETWVHGEAVIRDPTGLHARPAVKLTKLAKSFQSTIEVRADEAGSWTNAKSPNQVMKLKARNGTPLKFRAAGEDAAGAVAALVKLVDGDFDG